MSIENNVDFRTIKFTVLLPPANINILGEYNVKMAHSLPHRPLLNSSEGAI